MCELVVISSYALITEVYNVIMRMDADVFFYTKTEFKKTKLKKKQIYIYIGSLPPHSLLPCPPLPPPPRPPPPPLQKAGGAVSNLECRSLLKLGSPAVFLSSNRPRTEAMGYQQANYPCPARCGHRLPNYPSTIL